jgi:hypothetical protein
MIAKKLLRYKLSRKYAAIKIQKIMRGKLARLYVNDIVARRLAQVNKAATIIQKWGRRLNAQILSQKLK